MDSISASARTRRPRRPQPRRRHTCEATLFDHEKQVLDDLCDRYGTKSAKLIRALIMREAAKVGIEGAGDLAQLPLDLEEPIAA